LSNPAIDSVSVTDLRVCWANAESANTDAAAAAAAAAYDDDDDEELLGGGLVYRYCLTR